jgi:hypothetical protein
MGQELSSSFNLYMRIPASGGRSRVNPNLALVTDEHDANMIDVRDGLRALHARDNEKLKGQYFRSQLTLNGLDGATYTHNIGHTNYAATITALGTGSTKVGDISYVKANNTLTVYNSGFGGIVVDCEIIA